MHAPFENAGFGLWDIHSHPRCCPRWRRERSGRAQRSKDASPRWNRRRRGSAYLPRRTLTASTGAYDRSQERISGFVCCPRSGLPLSVEWLGVRARRAHVWSLEIRGEAAFRPQPLPTGWGRRFLPLILSFQQTIDSPNTPHQLMLKPPSNVPRDSWVLQRALSGF